MEPAQSLMLALGAGARERTYLDAILKAKQFVEYRCKSPFKPGPHLPIEVFRSTNKVRIAQLFACFIPFERRCFWRLREDNWVSVAKRLISLNLVLLANSSAPNLSTARSASVLPSHWWIGTMSLTTSSKLWCQTSPSGDNPGSRNQTRTVYTVSKCDKNPGGHTSRSSIVIASRSTPQSASNQSDSRLEARDVGKHCNTFENNSASHFKKVADIDWLKNIIPLVAGSDVRRASRSNGAFRRPNMAIITHTCGSPGPNPTNLSRGAFSAAAGLPFSP